MENYVIAHLSIDDGNLIEQKSAHFDQADKSLK